MIVNRQFSIGAASAVNVSEGSGDLVGYLNGNINQDGQVSVNFQIQNWDLYTKNKKEVDADRKAFEDEVYSYVNKEKEDE